MQSNSIRGSAKRNPSGHLIVLSALMIWITGASQGAGIRINELQASNKTTILDPDFNQFTDWIELYNPNPSAADLTGYSLSDDPENPAPWAIPAGVSIPANGFLLIFADGRDVRSNALHANFKLKGGGEGLRLLDHGIPWIPSVQRQPSDARTAGRRTVPPWSTPIHARNRDDRTAFVQPGDG
jgi:hypothetical protein